jgi:hypothetical protein
MVRTAGFETTADESTISGRFSLLSAVEFLDVLSGVKRGNTIYHTKFP